VSRRTIVVAVAALAATAAVAGGVAWAEDFYDENGNKITEEQFYELYGDDAEPDVPDVPASEGSGSSREYYETPADSQQDGF